MHLSSSDTPTHSPPLPTARGPPSRETDPTQPPGGRSLATSRHTQQLRQGASP
jgi:hypothetical protein